METSVFGYTAVITSFFTLLPQLYKTYKTKSVADISTLMWIFLLATNISWLMHGIVINDTPLFITNAFASITDLIMISFKIKYKAKA